MEFEPKLYLRFIISISISYLMGLYLLFQHIYLRRAIIICFCFFIDELRIFSHIGFTYTTYIYVKRKFRYFDSKKLRI